MSVQIELPIKQIVEDYQSGKESGESLARKFDASRQTILRRLAANGVRIRSHAEAQLVAEEAGRFSPLARMIQQNAMIKYHREHSQVGENNPNWSGGRYKDPKGYILVLELNHPHRSKKGYVREHRLVMEQHLGRYLHPWEYVHHRNQVRDDNRLENLEVVVHTNHYGEVTCPSCGHKFMIK